MFTSSILKDDFDEFNFIDYQKLQKLEREERRKAIESTIDKDLKKKFCSRKSYLRRDPKISNWWLCSPAPYGHVRSPYVRSVFVQRRLIHSYRLATLFV
jgi:hypothetical protein